MIDFQLTPADEKILSSAHEQAIIGGAMQATTTSMKTKSSRNNFPKRKICPTRSRWRRTGSAAAAARGFCIRW